MSFVVLEQPGIESPWCEAVWVPRWGPNCDHLVVLVGLVCVSSKVECPEVGLVHAWMPDLVVRDAVRCHVRRANASKLVLFEDFLLGSQK